MKKLWDKIGIIISVGCMLHCMLMPIVLPILFSMGFVFDHEGGFHLILAGIIIIIAVIALSIGHTHHHNGKPIILASTSILILIITGGCEIYEIHNLATSIFTIIGSCMVAASHYINHILLCKCAHHKCDTNH